MSAGWHKLRPILGRRLLPVGALGAVSLASGLFEASILTLIANIAAAMVLAGHRVSIDLGPIVAHMTMSRALVVALLMTVGRTLLQLVVAWLPARISANVEADLRNELFDAFTRASWAAKSADREGHFQELMTNQLNYVIGAVMNVAGLISSGAMFLALVASAVSLSPVAAGAVLGSAALLFAAFRPLDRAGGRAARDESQAFMDQAGGISEAVRLAEDAEVFGVTGAYREHLRRLVAAAKTTSFRASLTLRLVGTLYRSAIYFVIVGGVAGIYFAHAGKLASLGAVVLILVRASSYGQQMQTANHALVQVAPYVDRVYGTVARYKASAPTSEGPPVPAIRSLAFEHVSFSYRPDEQVLHDISFEVEAGQTIGVIGPTGAGKSTVSQLLIRLRDPEHGAYLLNGRPIYSFNRTDWQRKVAYVPQEPRLFDGTIAENIRFFRNIEQTEIEHAARLAHIDREILAMPRGYATPVGQRADAVSGGQRQRICLARALAGRPSILLLDEPTSALDLESEAAVLASLAGLHGSMTTFVIAHRLSFLRICDRVLVLENGRVSAFAPVQELARTDHFYQRVASLVEDPRTAAQFPSHT